MIPAPEPPPAVWRPYTDAPVLTAAMARAEAVPDAELDALRRYLNDLVAARAAPVHICVAFNAAYFGYDMSGQGYGVAALDPDAFPEVSFYQRVPALPVGAMVCLPTGADPLYAEIVYKEGRHPALTPLGDVPEWLSGAPAGAQGPATLGTETSPARDELLVPDFHAFGAALSPSSAQLNRLRMRERWIDRRGHVTVSALYESAESAERDDTSRYIDYLLTTARAQLLSPLVPASLVELAAGGDERSLRSALVTLMGIVRGVLAGSDQLRMWGPYAMTRASLTSCWQDSGPLGMADMSRLVSSLEHAAKPSAYRRQGRPATAAYTAIGPRLSEFPGTESLLSGPGYVRAVCRANFAIASAVSGESDEGRFASGVWVGLDDAFLGGGVWRSCVAGPATAAGLRADPASAGAEGWRSTVMAPTAPLDEPLPPEQGLGLSEVLSVSASEVVWRVPLRLAHIVDEYLPLHSSVSAQLPGTGSGHCPIRVELSHAGEALEDSEALQDAHFTARSGAHGGRLSGIEWPLSFFPGLELQVQWPQGGRVLRITTTLLDTPVTVNDQLIEHRYDPAVLTRDNAPGSSRTGDSASGLTVRQLILRAVRRCGLLTPDGHALIDRAALPRILYSEATAAEAAMLAATVTDLLATGDLYAATGSRSRDGVPHWPARPDESGIPLLGYEPTLRQPVGSTSAGAVGAATHCSPAVSHYVSGHLRRLAPGHTPSQEQRAAYREHCRRLGKAGERELPPHYTYIAGHFRCR